MAAKSLSKNLFTDAFRSPGQEGRYWIGMLMADGTVCRPPESQAWRIRLALMAEDGEHVQRFASFLRSDGAISLDRSQGTFLGQGRIYTSVCSRQMVLDLCRYGVTPRKSMREQVFELDKDADFWRGCVDGDGCLGMSRQPGGRRLPYISLCGSQVLMEQFSAFAKEVATGVVARVVAHGKIWTVRMSGIHALKLIGKLYQNAVVALARKAILAKECMTWKPSRTTFDWHSLTPERLTQLYAECGGWSAVARRLKVRLTSLWAWRRRNLSG